MKIAIDCRMSGKSGIGTFLDGILPYFKNSGNELYLFGTEENPCGIKTFSLKELFCFPKKILKKINSCDVYFTPYCNIPSGIKIPIFSTIHDVVFLDVKGLSSKLGILARKFFYKRAVKKSKGIFTVSQFSRQRIIHHLKCKKQIYVVYNGTGTKPIEDFSKITKADEIIFIGNIKKHKGLKILLEAFKKILEEQNAKIKLLIVGNQNNFRTKDDEIENMILKINGQFAESINFTGFISNEKLSELLQRSKILVQPSLYEGFGIPPLEALYSGTRAVISDIPVFKEIYGNLPVTFFKSGDSDDLKEKILKAYNDESPVPKVSEEWRKKYSYENTASLVLKNLHSLIEN